MAKPIYEHYDDLMKGRISRRDFFKRSAAAGAATPLILNYLNNPASASAAPNKHFSLTRTMGQAAKLTPPPQGTGGARRRYFLQESDHGHP